MSQTLVLLHGWGLNSAVWDRVLPTLEDHFTVQAMDIPGFGGAPWNDDLSDINNLADTIAVRISADCAHSVVLAGWSMGGLIATVIALRHPHLVSRLHTIASSPCFVAQTESGWPGIDGEVLQTFEAQLATDFQATVKRFLAVQALGSPHARQDVKALQATVLSRPMADSSALAMGLRWLATVDLRDHLSHLQMPLHRAYGRLDSLVPLAVTDQISVGSCVIWQKSAHAPFLNQPEDFCNWLLTPPSDTH